MANIPIWPGSSSFAVGDTAFGFYDTDSDFQNDAPNIATWCAQRLGYPLVDVELQAVNFFTCFEEAITEYGHQVYTFQIVNNLFRIKGKATGSALNQIYLDDYYGSDYGGGAGSQGSGTSYNLTDTRLFSASLAVKRNQQKYNLLSQAPGFSTANLTFTGTPTPSQSLTIIATNGSSHTYTAHASSSAYHVSSSLNQFETGSSAVSAATNLADLINLCMRFTKINAIVA